MDFIGVPPDRSAYARAKVSEDVRDRDRASTAFLGGRLVALLAKKRGNSITAVRPRGKAARRRRFPMRRFTRPRKTLSNPLRTTSRQVLRVRARTAGPRRRSLSRAGLAVGAFDRVVVSGDDEVDVAGWCERQAAGR